MGKVLCAIVALVCANAAAAKLTNVEIEKRNTFQFKSLTYESISGYLHFSFDPKKLINQSVTDIQWAETDENGLVAAKANFYLIQPVDKVVSGTLFEISNRGGKASLRYFNQAPRNALPESADSLGDGLIQDLGLRMLWVGWQADVPKRPDTMHVDLPLAVGQTGLVRSDWTLEQESTELSLAHRSGIETIYLFDDKSDLPAYLTKRQTRNGKRTIVESATWQVSEDRKSITGEFAPGIYELVYPSRDPFVVGLGLAILRDTAAYLKTSDSLFPSLKVIGFGVSQTGRLLRHFLYQGFNQSEDGRKAFDGLLIHTAGAGRGSFNHRFGQPSRDAHRLSAFFYPTDIFPFTSRATKHPITGAMEGLLDNQSKSTRPKILYTNTGYEYWGRAASLIHTSSNKDVLPLENERIYHLASGQHFVEPRSNLQEIGEGIYIGNPLDFLTHLRALLRALTDWVTNDIKPPESQYPTYSDRQLVAVSEYVLPTWLSALRPPRSPHTAYLADYGKQWAQGVIDTQPPRLLAEITPSVPNVDEWGNELGGIRHPFIDEPLAAFLPWAIRNQGFAPNELMDFKGALILMSKSNVLDRYDSWDAYLTKLNVAIDNAIEERVLLPRDRERLIEQARWLWDKVMASQSNE